MRVLVRRTLLTLYGSFLVLFSLPLSLIQQVLFSVIAQLHILISPAVRKTSYDIIAFLPHVFACKNCVTIFPESLKSHGSPHPISYTSFTHSNPSTVFVSTVFKDRIQNLKTRNQIVSFLH